MTIIAEKGVSQRKQELTELAYQLIAEKGFEGLRTREIAARAGINSATLHYYFPTKEAVVQSVVQYLVTRFHKLSIPPPKWQVTALEQLRWEFSTIEYRLREQPDLLVVTNELQLHSLREPAIQPYLNEMAQAWHKHLTELIRRGVDEGTFREDLEIESTATALGAMMRGYGFRNAESLRPNEIARLAAQVERWLVK